MQENRQLNVIEVSEVAHDISKEENCIPAKIRHIADYCIG